MFSRPGFESRPALPASPQRHSEVSAEEGPEELTAAFDLAYYTPLQEHRAAADTKAGGILTATGLLVTVLARYSPHILGLTGQAPLAAKAAILLVLAGFVLFAIGAVVRAFQTISPRFRGAPESLTFFGDIARLDRDEYVRRVEALSREEALRHMLSYNHTLSTIIVEKFRDLNRAIRLFEGAFLCWLVLAALIAWDMLH